MLILHFSLSYLNNDNGAERDHFRLPPMEEYCIGVSVLSRLFK